MRCAARSSTSTIWATSPSTHVKLSSGSVMKVTAANLVRSETGFFALGQRVSLSFSPDACIVLDR